MKKQSLTGRRQNGGGQGLAHGLGHHVADQRVGRQREGDALAPHGDSAEGHHLRIVPENRHQLGRENVAHNACRHQKQRAPLDAEAEALPHPVIELGAVVEAADRLKP